MNWIFKTAADLPKRALKASVLPLLLASALLLPFGAGASDVTDIQARGVLRVAVTNTYAYPFMTVNEKGEYVGFEMDLAKLFAERLGVKLEIIPVVHYDDIVEKVEKHEADIGISQLSSSYDRASRVLLSQPYARLKFALLVKRIYFTRTRGREGLDDFVRNFRGTINVHGQTVHQRMMSTLFPRAQIVPVNTRGDEGELLASCRMEACFDDVISIRNLCSRNNSSSIYYQRVVLSDIEDEIVIAINAKCYHLMTWVNGMLEQNKAQIKQRVERPEEKPMPFL